MSSAAVGMMANWNLVGAETATCPGFPMPLTLVAAERDRAVPPGDARAIAAMLPDATVLPVQDYGHLAHEEAPVAVRAILSRPQAVPA